MAKDIYVFIEHLRGNIADISYITLAAARGIAVESGESIVAVLLGHNAQKMADDLFANRVLYFDHPNLENFSPAAYQQVMAHLIHENMPRLVLFGETSIGTDLAGALSGKLNLPLVSNCSSIQIINGSLKYKSQICGGKIIVEGKIPEMTSLITMIPGSYKTDMGKTTESPVIVWGKKIMIDEQSIYLEKFIEPEVGDVDISKENILIAIGRGIEREDNIPMAKELADALKGVLSASRPIVDMGWLPTTRLVGRSGKRVKPKLYLALGISGAPEHVEAIADSEMIIAINIDPEAPIFNLAKYGAAVDMLDLLPALTENIRSVRTTVIN
jgi:electron transfer flavoprotein alpha subunit